MPRSDAPAGTRRRHRGRPPLGRPADALPRGRRATPSRSPATASTASSSCGASSPSRSILDVRLPRLDGWDVLARLKADPATASLPVVIVSMIDERGRGFALGAAEYLVKPVGRERLPRRAGALRPRTHRATAPSSSIDDDPMDLDLRRGGAGPRGLLGAARGRRRGGRGAGRPRAARGGPARPADARGRRVRGRRAPARRSGDGGGADRRADGEGDDQRRPRPAGRPDRATWRRRAPSAQAARRARRPPVRRAAATGRRRDDRRPRCC